MKHTRQNQHGFGAVELLLVLIILCLVGAVCWMVYQNQTRQVSDNASSSDSPSNANFTSKYCYIHADKLDCINQSGAELEEHALPTVNDETITQLMPNTEGNQYVAYTDKQHIYLLDEQLSKVATITIPSELNTDTGSLPTWSHDGKSLLLEIDTPDNSSTNWRRIYRYDIKSQKFTQLTFNDLNRTPFETKDGHIVYLRMGGDIHTVKAGWEPYIMNADGTDAKPFTAVNNDAHYSAAYTDTVSPSLDLNYDASTDSVFVSSLNNQISFETVRDLRSGKPPTTITVSGISASLFPGSLARMSSEKILLITPGGEEQKTTGEIIDLKSGNTVRTIDDFGSFIVGQVPNVNSLQ